MIQQELFDTKEKVIYLIDGSAFIFRAYHAIRNLSNSKGFPTNAIFGFANILNKLLNEKQPEYAIMLFDMKGPTFRHEMYSEYKANRPPAPEDLVVQISHIKELTEAFNIPLMEMQGYEADDLTGTLAKLAQEKGFKVIMVTGDKDFKQLVTENAIIWDPMKDRTFTIESINEEHGVGPEKIIEIMGLTGDTSDNVPGVPGIGPKTASVLIKEFGSIENIYKNLDSITKKKQKENLISNKDMAFLSKKLVTIKEDIPLTFNADEFRLTGPNEEKLHDLFSEFEFKKFLKGGVKKKTHKKTYTCILTEEDLDNLIQNLEEAGEFAVDTETTSKNPMLAELVGLSFSYKDHEACYIPCKHNYPRAPEQLEKEFVLDKLKGILENPDIKKIGQNIKYDWIVLKNSGITMQGVFFDTMLASYLLNPSLRGHSLDKIAEDYLGHSTIPYSDVAGKGKSALLFNEINLDIATPYASEDADITRLLYQILSKELEDAGLTDLMHDIEMPLVPVLMAIERDGIKVDKEKLTELSNRFNTELTVIKSEIYNLAGEEFNINSSQQLGKILFEKLELPVVKKTKKKTGYSTDVDVLTKLSQEHDLPKLLLRYRTLSKLKSTYTDALIDLIHPETGRIHTSFNQTVAATGRLSSSDPNLQNIPIRTEEGREIRKAFVAREGWKLLAADYSQVELRVLAHCSDDEIFIESFKNGEDIHTRTASEVFQEFAEMVTPDMRRQAKAINFGIVYGMSAFGLSRDLEISRKKAQEYIDNYFARYSGVKTFMETTVEKARETGHTSTLSGRLRNIPEITSSNKNVRQFAERIAINTPIQGTAADLIKLAMIQMDEKIQEKNLKSIMVLSVHDEIVFEVPEQELEEMTQLTKEVMENIWDLKVPLKVNIDIGDNWSEAH